MKRLFWFGLGVAAGVAASRKAQGAVRRITPAGAAENVGDAVRELAAAVGSFGADVRSGMVEREAELYASVGRRTGIDTAPRHLVRRGSGWTMPPEQHRASGARASAGARASGAGEAQA